jgi:hypothetical protein
MALTLQRKLELAGDLAKVQPMLQRLHLVEKPRKRRHVRNVILVGSAVGAGAVALILMRRRRGCDDCAMAGNGAHMRADPPTQDTPHAEPGRESTEDSPSAGDPP